MAEAKILVTKFHPKVGEELIGQEVVMLRNSEGKNALCCIIDIILRDIEKVSQIGEEWYEVHSRLTGRYVVIVMNIQEKKKEVELAFTNNIPTVSRGLSLSVFKCVNGRQTLEQHILYDVKQIDFVPKDDKGNYIYKVWGDDKIYYIILDAYNACLTR